MVYDLFQKSLKQRLGSNVKSRLSLPQQTVMRGRGGRGRVQQYQRGGGRGGQFRGVQQQGGMQRGRGMMRGGTRGAGRGMTRGGFRGKQGIILCMHLTNKKHYNVTSLIGWLHSQNDPW